MYKHATARAETRPGHHPVGRIAPASPGIRSTSRTPRLHATLALTALIICATIGALWTCHDLRHPQDSFSPATPLLGIALLLLATRLRRRPR
ncbi:MAG: hypothetical protein ACR2JE_10695 [Acidobacteriaceae bacterium]